MEKWGTLMYFKTSKETGGRYKGNENIRIIVFCNFNKNLKTCF